MHVRLRFFSKYSTQEPGWAASPRRLRKRCHEGRLQVLCRFPASRRLAPPAPMLFRVNCVYFESSNYRKLENEHQSHPSALHTQSLRSLRRPRPRTRPGSVCAAPPLLFICMCLGVFTAFVVPRDHVWFCRCGHFPQPAWPLRVSQLTCADRPRPWRGQSRLLVLASRGCSRQPLVLGAGSSWTPLGWTTACTRWDRGHL